MSSTEAEAKAKAEAVADKAAEAAEKTADKAAEKTADKAAEAAEKATPTRSPDEVAAELASARVSLVSNLDAIKDRVNPKHVAERRFASIRRIYVSDEGEPNVRNIAITAGVVAILVLYRIRK